MAGTDTVSGKHLLGIEDIVSNNSLQILCQVVTTFWRWWEIYFYHQKRRSGLQEKMFYFKDTRKEVSAMWDTVKAGVKKEGGEITEWFDTLEQSRAKQKGTWAKHSGYRSCRTSKSTKEQIPNADLPAARKPPHILCSLCYVYVLDLHGDIFESWKNGWEGRKSPALSLLDRNNSKGQGIICSA